MMGRRDHPPPPFPVVRATPQQQGASPFHLRRNLAPCLALIAQFIATDFRAHRTVFYIEPPAEKGSIHMGNQVMLTVLRSPLGRLFHGLCELEFVGRRTGRAIHLPVQFARDRDQVAVYVGRSAGKRWWRNFIDPNPVQISTGGRTFAGTPLCQALLRQVFDLNCCS